MASTLAKALRSDPISRLPLRAPCSASPDATIEQVVRLMTERRTGYVLLLDGGDGKLVGIFTERDLLTRVVLAGRDPKTTPVSLVMTREVRFVTPGTTVEAALALIHVHRHRHLLVIDGPKVHGLVSIGDLVREMIERGVYFNPAWHHGISAMHSDTLVDEICQVAEASEGNNSRSISGAC